jgi:very-short-patch-repair endonuclease
MARRFGKPPKRAKASKLHRQVLALLRGAFPGYDIGEEDPIPVEVLGRRSTLFVDLSLPGLRVAVECHGRQHYEYVQHFHGTREKFLAQQTRDLAKAQTLAAHGWTLVIVRFDEIDTLTAAEMADRILAALQEEEETDDDAI